jgi:glutamate/tyrosine decarboxylase-like PLP-dependent enzyme
MKGWPVSLLDDAARRATGYLRTVPERRVAPAADAVAALARFREPLPERLGDPDAVLAMLDELGSPATVTSTGGRYFGFVIGGAIPVTVGASWLAAAWDQNASFVATSPVAAVLEDVALGWLRALLGLPAEASGALVTGATMASFTALAAARRAVLLRAGWDVEARGLFGAPPITVVVGGEVHVTILKALAMLGLGRERVVRVPVDGQGRMRADALPPLDASTIVCAQTGNVNTGAFDPIDVLAAAARAAGAWLHVDGAIGLWARTAPARAHLAAGVELADSWSVDGHKWLNVPYDCGIAFVRDAAAHRGAMATTAAYAQPGDEREPCQFTPEFSRRARGVEVWAALRTLGRAGVGEMVERSCRQAVRMAEHLRAAGLAVLNEVVLNQVLVSFGDAERTQRAIAAIQRGGECWCGGTVWQGHTAMRISVSGWATTDEDIDRAAAAIAAVARGFA